MIFLFWLERGKNPNMVNLFNSDLFWALTFVKIRRPPRNLCCCVSQFCYILRIIIMSCTSSFSFFLSFLVQGCIKSLNTLFFITWKCFTALRILNILLICKKVTVFVKHTDCIFHRFLQGYMQRSLNTLIYCFLKMFRIDTIYKICF